MKQNDSSAAPLFARMVLIVAAFFAAGFVLAPRAGSVASPDPRSHPLAEIDEARQRGGDPLRIELRGCENRWEIYYGAVQAGASRAVETLTSADVHVPVDQQIVLALTSTDFVYTLALPELELKQIAVPNLEFQIELPLLPEGQYQLIGEQLCGNPHTRMESRLIVESSERFLRWVNQQTKHAPVGIPAR